MMGLLHLLRHGRGLRHLPIVYPDQERVSVRVLLCGEGGEAIDVTRDHVPVSLRPLVLGLRLEDSAGELASPRLEFRDALANDRSLASIDLTSVGRLPLSRGHLRLFETSGCRNWCVTAPTRWTRYALAWQHARRAPARGDALCMPASDLRCLNAYYISPRPVYLVSVAHGGRSNIFPMDLVGPVSSGDFLLALRATSPSIEVIESSRQIAMSGAPANQREAIYALGAHHHKKSVDVTTLPFEFEQSELFNLPVLPGMGLVRELAVREVHRVGSHVLFVTQVQREAGRTEHQLAHMSGMYAEHLAKQGRPVQAVVAQ
jgi:flavin reductase (DIM6/NTAB) family NADH-FMN oxidoreductase RutF